MGPAHRDPVRLRLDPFKRQAELAEGGGQVVVHYHLLEQVSVLHLHLLRCADHLLEVLLVESPSTGLIVFAGDELGVFPGLPQPLHGRRFDEHHEGFELRCPQVFYRVWLDVDETHFALGQDGADGVQAGPIVVPLVLSILYELVIVDVRLKEVLGDEMVLHSIRLLVLFRPAGVRDGDTEVLWV